MDLTGSPFNDTSGGGGAGIWHLSEQPSGFDSSSYYHPYILRLPKFSEGGFDDGWLAPSYGSLVIANRPTDSDHPFSGTNLGVLVDNPMSAIPTTLYWDGNKIGEVACVLKDLTETSLSFQVEAPVQSLNLLRLYLAENSTTAEVVEIADNGSGKCRITFSATHPFSVGELLFFMGMDLVGSELNSDSTSNTIFLIEDVPTASTIDLDKSFSDISFANPLTANETVSGGYIYTTDTLVDNIISVDSPVTINPGVTLTVTGTLSVTVVERRLPENLEIPSGFALSIIGTDTSVAVSGASTSSGQLFYDAGSATESDNQLGFAFGTTTLENPVFILNTAKTRVGNPNLLVTLSGGNAAVQDDGVAEAIDTGASTDFASAPSNTFPMLVLSSGAINGEASVSGTTGFVDRTNGDSTASDFFVFVGQTLGYDVVQTLAPNSDTSTAELAIFETRQQRLVDFVALVARGLNYQFYIDEPNKTIHVIDRANSPASSLTLYPEDISAINLGLPGPVGGLVSTRRYNSALGDGSSANAYKLQRLERFVRLAIADTGRDRSIRTFAPSMTKATKMMIDIRTIMLRPRIEVTVSGINTDVSLGERVDFFSETLGVSGYLVARKRSWDFANEQTTWGGDAVIDPYTQAGTA
jgi:hypothetical protein